MDRWDGCKSQRFALGSPHVQPLAPLPRRTRLEQLAALIPQTDDAQTFVVEPEDFDFVIVIGQRFRETDDHFVLVGIAQRDQSGDDLNVIAGAELTIVARPRDATPVKRSWGNPLVFVKPQRQHARCRVDLAAIDDQVALIGLDADQLRSSQQLPLLQFSLPLFLSFQHHDLHPNK